MQRSINAIQLPKNTRNKQKEYSVYGPGIMKAHRIIKHMSLTNDASEVERTKQLIKNAFPS
jgi:hypothetical protein